jgi:hypothetical protein
MTRTTTIIIAAAALATAAHAQLIIPGVSATTDMGSGFGTSLDNTLNGMGLIGGVPSLTAQHEPTTPINSWVADMATIGQVTFDLNGLYQVNGFSFWNQNAGGPGPNGATGINGVVIEASTDGVNFSVIPGAPSSFAVVPDPFADPEIFSFAAVDATHIRFNIRSNHGDPAQTGFAEVHFSQVPAPGALALFGLTALSRRRRCA